jgi:hypothetical protein
LPTARIGLKKNYGAYMSGRLFCLLFCLVSFTHTQDQFWLTIENDLFRKVNLANFSTSKQYLDDLMERAQQLNAINKKVKNALLIRNNQEAIEALLSVYIYVEALTRYLFPHQIREKLASLDEQITAYLTALNTFQAITDIGKKEDFKREVQFKLSFPWEQLPEKLENLQKERDQLSNQLSKIYSQNTLTEIINKTFLPFEFIQIQANQIAKIAGDIQNFIGTALYSAKKNDALTDSEMQNVYRYIQLAPLISDEYAAKNGRFYLKALEEALVVSKNLIEIGQVSYEKNYNDLFKKLIAITSTDFIILTAVL